MVKTTTRRLPRRTIPTTVWAEQFSQNIERAKKMASRIETGMVYINWLTDTAAELPFGGVKRSGYGRELSDLGIKEFVNQKLVVVRGDVIKTAEGQVFLSIRWRVHAAAEVSAVYQRVVWTTVFAINAHVAVAHFQRNRRDWGPALRRR